MHVRALLSRAIGSQPPAAHSGASAAGSGPGSAPAQRLQSQWQAHVVRRARDVVGAAHLPGPPFWPERYAGFGDLPRTIRVPHRLPHTPQWNGAVAIALARTFLPSGVSGAAGDALAEIGAAELLLPMRAFRPIADRTDLTMDGVRVLAMRFAAPIRLTVRQWLRAGTWRGYALLWRYEGGTFRLRWQAASPGIRLPRTAVIGAPAEAVWADALRLHLTHRTGRSHHGVEEVRTGAGRAWWFTRFGVVRDDAGAGSGWLNPRAVLALVTLARGR